jgi:hypothetical protein
MRDLGVSKSLTGTAARDGPVRCGDLGRHTLIADQSGTLRQKEVGGDCAVDLRVDPASAGRTRLD